MKQLQFLRTITHATIFLSLFISLFFHPQSALACSCVVPGPPNVEFSTTEGVFSGKVMQITDKYNIAVALIDRTLMKIGARGIWAHDLFYGYNVTFSVSKSWKLIDANIVQIYTGNGYGDCGYRFDIGKDYLVYVYRSYGKPNGRLGTSICSRNAELSAATVDLAYLNTLPTIPLKSPLAKIISISFFIFISLLASIIYIWKRRKNLTKDV